MSILEELYNGNTQPYAKQYKQNSCLIEAEQLKIKNLKKLMLLLDDSEKERFKKYDDVQSEINEILKYYNFSYGFKLGILLMMEAIQDMEELL